MFNPDAAPQDEFDPMKMLEKEGFAAADDLTDKVIRDPLGDYDMRSFEALAAAKQEAVKPQQAL